MATLKMWKFLVVKQPSTFPDHFFLQKHGCTHTIKIPALKCGLHFVFDFFLGKTFYKWVWQNPEVKMLQTLAMVENSRLSIIAHFYRIRHSVPLKSGALIVILGSHGSRINEP